LQLTAASHIGESGPRRAQIIRTGFASMVKGSLYAEVGSKRCVRVREGGEVLHTIELDRDASRVCSAEPKARRCSWSRPSGKVSRRIWPMGHKQARYLLFKRRHRTPDGHKRGAARTAVDVMLSSLMNRRAFMQATSFFLR